MPRTSWEKLGDYELFRPPLAEQRAIADYLDAETARIDALIAKKQQLIHLLEERELSLVDALFSPRPNERLTRLARHAQVRSGVTLNGAKPVESSDLELPYLRVANVQPGRLDLSEVKKVSVSPELASRCSLEEGDVLMTEGGDIDKLGRGTVWNGDIEPCLHQNHVFAVRVDQEHLSPHYLSSLTRTSHARSYFESTGSRSTNLASTNSSKVGDFLIPAIERSEQLDRVKEFDRLVRPLRSSSSVLHRQLGLMSERRQALITASVTGEFKVPVAA